MATKKTATKKSTKAASAKKTSKPRIKTVEETSKGVVEVKASKAAPKSKKPAKAKTDRKISAIDAAAKVLGEAKEPLSTKQMVETMSSKGYWTSPGGKTPHATLYSAILRENNAKGKNARFVKTERGRFTTKA